MDFTLENLLTFMGRLHPATVHFPIALILTALLFETFTAIRHRDRRSRMAIQCLIIGAIGAAAAAWFGWINAENEPYGRSVAQTVFIHRWSGVVAAGLAVLALLAAALVRDGRPVWAMRTYRGALLASAALIGVGSYLGGELVHGEGHLLTAFRPEAPVQVATPRQAPPPTGSAQRVSFQDVKPILAEHCVHCHGAQRQRGSLRLDELALMFEGPEDLWVARPGDADGSELVRRIELTADDLDLMPADGEPLRAEDVALIRRWIDEGAAASRLAGGEAVEPSAATSANATADRAAPTRAASPPPERGVAPTAPAPAPTPDAFGVALTVAAREARDAAIDRLVTRGGVAAPVAENAAAVDVNLSLADPSVTDDDLATLAGLESSLVWLDLSRSAVTDEGLETLGRFTRLRRLRLDNTPITDAGLRHLESLVELRSLNLYGTSVSDEGLTKLAVLPALERLYLWNTAVTDAGAESLREGRPGLQVDLGATLPPEPGPVEIESVSFVTHILPILEEHCVHCHGPKRMRADLRLDEHELVLKGGEGGLVVTPGNLAGSTLVQRITLPADDPDLMPADDNPLAQEQVDLIRAWIEEGAKE